MFASTPIIQQQTLSLLDASERGDVQHWELLPAQAALNVRVGSIGGGSLGFPEFPKWLGNYSRENKRRRLLGELSTHLNASVSGGTEVSRGPRYPLAPRWERCWRIEW